MSATDLVNPIPRRISFWPPRPIWIALWAVVLIGVAVGLRIGIPIYRQYAAIRDIKRAGCRYIAIRPRDLTWLPHWLQDWVFEPERREVFSKVMNGLGTVEEIGCVGPGFTDDAMAQIASLTELRRLYLGHRPIELRQVSGPILLPYFEPLNVKYRRSDPAQISDAGLAHLNRMRGLEVLDLSCTSVTDSGLAHLENLTQLRSLDLHGTQVTDKGLRHLRGLVKLECLDLRRTQVSDSGLAELYGLTNLEALALDDEQITGATFTELRSALPKLTIVW